jgi:hypothetical protein
MRNISLILTCIFEELWIRECECFIIGICRRRGSGFPRSSGILRGRSLGMRLQQSWLYVVMRRKYFPGIYRTSSTIRSIPRAF